MALQLGPVFDQCSASKDPVGNGLTDLCIAQGIPAEQIGVFEAGFFPTQVELGSNPDLEAEEADTFTAGLVWAPGAGSFTASIDYFDIEIDDASVLMFPDEAVRLCFLTRDISDPFCSLTQRGPSNSFESARITFVSTARATSKGLDLALNAGIAADRLALFEGSAGFDLSIIATRYLEATARSSPLAPAFDCAGKFGALCDSFPYQGALPEFRLNARLTYRSGPLAVSLRWRHIGSMDSAEDEFRAASGLPPPMLAVDEVGSTNYFDLSLNAELDERVDLKFGVENLFDEDPPFLGSGNQAANTDPKTYDTLGRRYYFRLTGRI
jgi:outer membrane receptor protein involved in Fe transport